MLISLILVVFGTGLLLFSACSIRSIIQLIGTERRIYRHWKVLFFLTLFFVIGYIGAGILIYLMTFDILVHLVGCIFFGGSLFVLLVTRVGLHTIANMESEVKEQVKELNLTKKEAVEANKAKSNFLATMSHEIRTPLSSIIAIVDILEEMQVIAEQVQYIQILKRASRNLLHQINDILDFSKIEAGKIELEAVPLVLHESLENVLGVMKVRCEEKGINLSTDIRIPKKLTVIGDPKRVEQILLNLMSNAVKFTFEGKISLEAKLREGEGKELIVDFAIGDTGVGVNPEKLDKIFESFSQADTSITRQFGGTGLGLSICKTLIQMAGGEIKISSCPNVGTTFSFYLKFTEAQQALGTEKRLLYQNLMQTSGV